MGELTEEIDGRLRVLNELHGPLDDDMTALGVITEEYHEVVEAMRRGDHADTRAELMDLAVACIRRVLTLDAQAAA